MGLQNDPHVEAGRDPIDDPEIECRREDEQGMGGQIGESNSDFRQTSPVVGSSDDSSTEAGPSRLVPGDLTVTRLGTGRGKTK